MNRKKFIKGALGSLGAFSIVPRHVLGGTGYTAPSDQLTKAVIGVCNMGKGYLTYPGERRTGSQYVDGRHLQHAVDIPDDEVEGHNAYGEVLQRKDVDVVHIATPRHWHGIIAKEAGDAAKDVWCEKPMTRPSGEGQKL